MRQWPSGRMLAFDSRLANQVSDLDRSLWSNPIGISVIIFFEAAIQERKIQSPLETDNVKLVAIGERRTVKNNHLVVISMYNANVLLCYSVSLATGLC